ncbi:MAG: two pore domain potassium channel family protein [Thiobacillus sp.]|nr:two pore domain potassium channel family protein [Thiobacillus sp.]
MALIVAVCVLLVVLTTVVHYEVLRLMAVSLPVFSMHTRAKLIVVIFGAFLAHFAEIALYAVAIFFLVRMAGIGSLGGGGHSSLAQCLYYSAETYSSLGYGDVAPKGPLRLLAGMEVLNGLLLIGWTASFTYISMERFWKETGRDRDN